MASTLLVKDVLWSVSALLQDTAEQFDRWTQAELVSLLDDAQLSIVKYLPLAGAGIFSMRLEPGSLQSIERVVPSKIRKWDGNVPAADVLGLQFLKPLHNMGADGITPGTSIRVIKGDALDSSTPGWRSLKGATVRQVVYDPALPLHFEVVPAVPASPQVWVRISMSTYPAKIPAGGDYTRLSADLTTLTIPDEYREDAINYVVARANMKDNEFADGNKADYFGRRFVEAINAKSAAMTGHNPNLARFPFSPEPIGAAK